MQSSLHVVVIDEIDAVFRKRTDSEDSGSITRNSVVNQILAKIDGVKSLPNVLTIAMTNRRELLGKITFAILPISYHPSDTYVIFLKDEALLRPGRLEVQVEVPFPDLFGRREILKIHFGGLRSKGRLSFPLCCAIDGINTAEEPRSQYTPSSKRQHLKQLALRPLSAIKKRSIVDLADEKYTGGFSGADIAGKLNYSQCTVSVITDNLTM